MAHDLTAPAVTIEAIMDILYETVRCGECGGEILGEREAAEKIIALFVSSRRGCKMPG